MASHENYKERLRAFNSTEKYKQELDFLYRLVAPRGGDKILDYGCGLGTAVYYFERKGVAPCWGYDVNNYRDGNDESTFRSDFHFKFSKVFFMHSLAHLPNVEQKLEDLKQFLKPEARVYVITPNKEYLDGLTGAGYVPDPTVVSHFYADTLEKVFLGAGYKYLIGGQFGNETDHRDDVRVHERLFLEAQWK